VPGEIRDAGDDPAAPVFDDFDGLLGKHLAGQLQIALVFLIESNADFQILQLPHRYRRRRDFGRSVRVPVNMFRNALHPIFSFVEVFAWKLPRMQRSATILKLPPLRL
jgi:hypothetical protein